MGKEVYCKCLHSILNAVEDKKLPERIWLKGIPYTLTHLRNKHERIEWTVFIQLMKNIKPFFTDEDYINMGSAWIKSPVMRAERFIPRILFDRGELLHLAQKHIERSGSQHFTCIDYKTTSLGPNGIRQELKVKPEYEYCREFFLITKGALEILFILLGRSTTSMSMIWIDRGAAYEIKCDEGGGILSGIRKVLTRPFTAKQIANELEETNEILLKRYQELEKAQLILQQQTKQLQTAFEINKAIRKNLDLDCVLESIVHALVEVASYAAVEINIHTEYEEKRLDKFANFGEIPPDRDYLFESLILEERKIGKIKVWPAKIMDCIESDELFKQVFPTILLAIHDALTYSMVVDYRKNLEKKVEQRTKDLKQTQEELRNTIFLLNNTQKAHDRFFTHISHEFRTPLTLIFGPANDISEKTTDPGIKKNAGVIKKNASRLYALVNQLLDISKLEEGKMKLEVSEQNIIPWLKGFMLSFASLAERKKITFRFYPPGENLNVFIDKEKVEKIVDNLLSNAFKFTPEEGRIELKVSKNEEYIDISVQDTGIGIPQEKISKIFDRFYQVDSSHKREHEGTGIGLALSKELIELHKGKIKVESSEGKGTMFTINLPISKKHYSAEEICKTVKSEEVLTDIAPDSIIFEENKNEKINVNMIIGSEKPVLLLVEDNSDVRSYMREYLEKGYSIIEAVDGEEGFKKSVEQIPDLIISDVMMPKVDGFELCEKLKTDERTSHIPIILLTAKATSQDKIIGYKTGADDYIVKPFDIKELCVRVKNLIDQRKKLRKHFQQEGIFHLDNKDITSVDRKFLERAVKIINEHISDLSFGVESFANELCIGRTSIYKKIAALVGGPPGDFIKRIRLSKASNLLSHKAGNISEIALAVGFSNPAYFAECFKKQFGVTPSKYPGNFTNH